MSDEKDDATTGETAGDSVAEDAQQARPSGKRSSGRRGRTALAEAPEPGSAVESGAAKKSADAKRSRNPFAAIWLFIRQVVGELKKVVTPSRRELVNYVLVVLVFVAFMMVLISLLDLAFGGRVRAAAEAPRVQFRVLAHHQPFRNSDLAVYDDVAQARMTPDVATGKDHGVLDLAIGMHVHVGEDQ